MPRRTWVEWAAADGLLRAYEPTADELAACADQLSQDYNEPHNRAMMANEKLMSPQAVIEHWAGLAEQADRPFLLERDGVLMGDADLRHIEAGRAEFAIMVGSRKAQGQGVGTRFAGMLHVLAFESLGLQRVYVSIIPPNTASRRLFEKLGYRNDDSAQARSYAEDPSDICMSVSRAEFESAWLHPQGARDAIRLGTRA
ncbi:MAG: GNAT family N-acetyltransferase [Deltaproteobacteria bacterium]|nr:GNAT family N-acetyltransferase [Deltaproteobacteria bacterium]